MSSTVKYAVPLIVLAGLAIATPTNRATAVTAEVAKKCHALTVKKFPPRAVGNPAAGSANGTGRAQQAFFKKCLEDAGGDGSN
jgi:hypothetical protein